MKPLLETWLWTHRLRRHKIQERSWFVESGHWLGITMRAHHCHTCGADWEFTVQ